MGGGALKGRSQQRADAGDCGPFRVRSGGFLVFCAPVSGWHGAIAQLGERLHGMQEVDGSIPSGSTNKINYLRTGRYASRRPVARPYTL